MADPLSQDPSSEKMRGTENPQSAVLNPAGLAALLGISPATIPSLRSRTPEKLPPPFLSRPLRWRREAVIRWMERREQEEEARIEREFGLTLRTRAR